MSSSLISKPPIFTFSTILSFFTLLGKGTYPFWIDHRTKSWAGVQLYFSDMITMVGFVIRIAFAKGAYASTTMPLFLQKVVISARVLKGWTSIWFTAGGNRIVGTESSSFNYIYQHLVLSEEVWKPTCLIPKFDTPPHFTLLSSIAKSC